MRPFSASLAILLGLAAQSALPVSGQTTPPACTGLCLQQVVCPNGGSTTISGKVYTPNGTDPLPNVQVYVPNAAVDAFTPGVSCPVFGAAPSGSPLVGTTTAVDGSFTISNVPVGTSIPLVAVTGRWRRQVTVAATTACADTAQNINMPRNQAEGDIPKFAVATGSADSVECVLRKVGLDDSEFTDPGGTGRINLFTGSGSPGARASAGTPSEGTLMSDAATLNGYDVLMLPCEGGAYTRSSAQLANLVGFANAGGRVYSSHFSYVWMYQNPPFNGVVNWAVNQASLPDGTATVDTSFSEGQTLAQWLQLVGASTVPGQIAVQTIRHDFNGVIAPTQSWLTLNNAAAGNPVMQFVFNAPVGAKTNQCGRVLFNEYHVENPVISSPGKIFPAECNQGAMTPQEKLLEYSLFELTSDGGAPTLTPTKDDFGSVAVGFTSAPHSFQWTNNSTFGASVSKITGSGDFAPVGNNCSSVAPGASCTINVVFAPTAIGARTGTLTVSSSGSTLTAALTGNGVPALAFNLAALDFGSVDVGATASKSFSVSNIATGPVPVPALVTTGDYAVTSCGAVLAAGATCTVTVTFQPTTTGARPGTLGVNSTSAAYPAVPVPLTGNGIDFALASSAGSGSVIAGLTNGFKATVTPIAGFSNPVTLTCATDLPASTCTVANPAFVPGSAVTTNVTITTTSKFTVIGYGGAGGHWLLALLATASGLLLCTRRKQTGRMLRGGAVLALLAMATLLPTGCSGKLPAQNASYTPPGTYTVTITATDGFLVHKVTYTLKVTVT